VESAEDVEVTLQTCGQFCASIYGVNLGCRSFEFYPEPVTEAPRCDLYGGSVAQALYMVIPAVPNVWYDVGCAIPDE